MASEQGLLGLAQIHLRPGEATGRENLQASGLGAGRHDQLPRRNIVEPSPGSESFQIFSNVHLPSFNKQLYDLKSLYAHYNIL